MCYKAVVQNGENANKRSTNGTFSLNCQVHYYELEIIIIIYTDYYMCIEF